MPVDLPARRRLHVRGLRDGPPAAVRRVRVGQARRISLVAGADTVPRPGARQHHEHGTPTRTVCRQVLRLARPLLGVARTRVPVSRGGRGAQPEVGFDEDGACMHVI